MVTRLHCWRGCLSKKGPPHTTCNPTRMLCHKHVNEMLGFLWITLTANSQKFVTLLAQSSHASQNKWKARRLCEEAPVFVLARITFVFTARARLKTSVRDLIASWWRAGSVTSRLIVSSSPVGSTSSTSGFNLVFPPKGKLLLLYPQWSQWLHPCFWRCPPQLFTRTDGWIRYSIKTSSKPF